MSFLDSIFNPIGNAVKSIVNPIYNSVVKPVYEQVAKPVYEHVAKPVFEAAAPILSQVAPIAGSLVGARFGGPQGAMLGGQVGSMAGGLLDNLTGHGQQQQQQPAAPGYAPQMPGPNYGGGLADMISRMGGGFDQRMGGFMPPEMQGRTFNQFGQGLGDFIGNRFGGIGDQIGFGLGDMARRFGSSFGERANQFVNPYVPEFMRSMPMGRMGGYASESARDWMHDRLSPYGINGFRQTEDRIYPEGPAPELPPRPHSTASFHKPWDYETPGMPPKAALPPPLPPRDHAPYAGGYRNPIEEMNARFASGQPFLRPAGQRQQPPMGAPAYTDFRDELKAKLGSGKPILRPVNASGRFSYSDVLKKQQEAQSPHEKLMQAIRARGGVPGGSYV